MLFCRLYFFKSTFSKKSFRNTTGLSNSADPDEARHILSGLVWVQIVCKGYQQTAKVATSGENVFSVLEVVK